MPSLIKKVTSTAKAPKVLGLYGQRVLVDRIIYISGQLVMDSSSAQLVAGEVAKEVKQAFTKMGEVLKTVGCDFTNANTWEVDFIIPDLDLTIMAPYLHMAKYEQFRKRWPLETPPPSS
ncbi:hypothetical protein H8959_009050 [Pygathrix nigripes]